MKPTTEIKKRLKGKTQTELASDLGVSVSYLNDVIKGRREPGQKMLKALGIKREKRIIYSRYEK